jgi:hypothetical protein
MALLSAFRSIIETDEQAKRQVDARLQSLHRRFLEHAARLDLSAAQAPTASAESDLRNLSADHRHSADLVKDALIARRASVPAGTSAVAPATGINHWARATEDLAALQQAHGEVLDAAAAILETHPELTDLFETLIRRTSEHITRVRNLIARADPQALN